MLMVASGACAFAVGVGWCSVEQQQSKGRGGGCTTSGGEG